MDGEDEARKLRDPACFYTSQKLLRLHIFLYERAQCGYQVTSFQLCLHHLVLMTGCQYWSKLKNLWNWTNHGQAV
jgi:hypothetical protein